MGSGRIHGSYGHRITFYPTWGYRLTWTVDYLDRSGRIRYPRSFHYDTDKVGAFRFSLKHEVAMPMQEKRP